MNGACIRAAADDLWVGHLLGAPHPALVLCAGANLSPAPACHLCLLASDMPCSLKASHAPNVAASTASETLARVSRMQRAIASAETAADFRSRASSAADLTHLTSNVRQAFRHSGLAT